MDSDKLAEQNFSVCCGQVTERQLRFGLMQDHMQSLDFDIKNFFAIKNASVHGVHVSLTFQS
jgi:hypothetical protein